jgi:hypothetical protein
VPARWDRMGQHLPGRFANRRVRRVQAERSRMREWLSGHLRLRANQDHMDEHVQRSDRQSIRDALSEVVACNAPLIQEPPGALRRPMVTRVPRARAAEPLGDARTLLK